jgi:hypothetical protein
MATLGSTRGGEARRRVAAALEEAQLRSREQMVALFAFVAAEVGLRLRPSWTIEHLQLAGGLFVQGLSLRNVQVHAALDEDSDGDGDSDSDGDSDVTADPPAGLEVAAHVDALLNTPVPGPGLNGGTADWTLVSLGYLGLVDAFTELDPDFTPPPVP